MEIHPTNVDITRLGGHQPRHVTPVGVFDRQRARGGHRLFPFVDFGMSVGKGKTTSSVVVSRGHIDPGPGMWIEQPGVVDAVRMLIRVNPGPIGSGIGEL